MSEPLLCLTASATLRDKPILSTVSQELVIASLEGKELSTSGMIDPNAPEDEDLEDIMYGMEEVNLLDNLNDGECFTHQPYSQHQS